jgi:type VI secretion system secreted protein VgrG
MANDPFLELSFSSGESSLSVRRFFVREELSGLFEVSVVARSHDHAIDLEKIAGQAAGFRIHTGFVHALAPKRLWTGVCSHFEQLQVEVSQKGESTYLVRIVPDLWLLTHRINNRIFQRKTLPEIVQAVLGEWKIQPKLLLNKKYLPHDYVVQYEESDYHFVCRLLERAGITFYFTFGDTTVLTLSDEPHLGTARGGPPIPAVDNPNREAELEFVTRVHTGQGVRPGKFTIREFDPRKKPDFPYFSKGKPAPAPEDFFEQYHYLPGDSLRVNPPDGGGGATPVADDKGRVRTSQGELDGRAARGLVSARRTRREVGFQSNCADLTPGLVFSIGHHPRSDLKPSEKLLITEITLEGIVNDLWTFSGKAVHARDPYQPELRTSRPRIAGVQSAMVVGPPGKEIYTDEFGRVRVQFHWDREGKYDDNSSCWIRVSQQWAGSGFGSQLVPRVGHEVLVGYLEGDPDQPVVVGRVYNNVNRVPHKLPDHKTRSTWKSDSSPHTGGFNEILYEDKKGEELFYVQAELDLSKLVKREEVERTYENRVVVVGKDRSAVVKSVDATLVGGAWTQQMIAPPSESDLKILKQEEPSVSPLPTTTEMISKRVIFTTGDATVAFDDDNIVFQANGDIVIHAHGKNAIFEGSHTYLNSRGPAAAPRPRAVEKVKPGTFSSTEGDERKILNPFQAARAELKYQALSAAQKKAFDALIGKAKSRDEEAYLKKALAAGRTVDEIAAFADRIRGQSPAWMRDNLKLTGSTTGTGVQQQFSTSCNATVVQAIHGELDPIYALQVHDENPRLDQADNRNPTRVNPKLAAEQKAMLESPYAGARFPGLTGKAGQATARSSAGGVGRFADDKLNDLSPTTGLGFQTQLVGKDVTTAQALSTIDSSLAQGAPVPLIIGQSSSQTAHYVLVTGVSDGQPKTYTIHDPWEGKTVTRTADQMTNGNLDIAGHKYISGIEKPTIL